MAEEQRTLKSELKKVVELRNEKKIIEAVKFVEEEIRLHLHHGTTETDSQIQIFQRLLGVVLGIGMGMPSHELEERTHWLLNTIQQIEKASRDIIEGYEAQINEFDAELEKYRNIEESQAVVSQKEIMDELERRASEKERVSEIQEGTENDIDGTREELKKLELLLKHSNEDPKVLTAKKNQLQRRLDALNRNFEALRKLSDENDREMSILRSYLNSLQVIKTGLPTGIIGKKLN